MCAVRLHAVQTPAKVLLPTFAQRAPPVFFVVLHGFLAHSGALNSFVTMLRNALDAHNHRILENNDTTSRVLPFHITTLDARNHGLSPHTPTHVLSSLVTDLESYLADNFPDTAREAAVHFEVEHPISPNHNAFDKVFPPPPIPVVAIGHSMGSMTWTQYLMNQFEKQSSTSIKTASSVTPSPVKVRGFVSMDMPPVTTSHMCVGLVEELVEIIDAMKRVEMSRISDLRSAHEEFFRCGMRDIRVRGLCTTNLALTSDPAHPTRKVASWKCNVPVLERSIRSGELFFPDVYAKPPLPAGETRAAAAARVEKSLTNPSVGSVPVLSLLGSASPIGKNPAYATLWERYAAKLEQHTIAGASHTVYYDKPRETIELVKTFLTRIQVL
jgi:pimeloyl-ACP methyl ester carboxylesterase